MVKASDTKYRLVNVSDHDITGVSIDASRIPCQHSNLPYNATIAVGSGSKDGHVFTMAAISGASLPKHIYVASDERPRSWLQKTLHRPPNYQAVPIADVPYFGIG
ncbi:hypothetical protein C8259_09010 [Nocardia nova]|uniref:Uncharacterized protein n=1 Tax=Nocardia nova TaxID=37330 RepID=A0A2T2Z898_9NOCA|nr:hypothetical protein C8259_09010 [Nocardia nova]